MRLSSPAIAALSAIALFVVLLLYGPLAVAIFFSFFRLERNAVQWDSFSFDAYRSLFQNRAILDALTQVCFGDDKQVTELLAAKYYTDVDGPAHVHVRVEPAPGQPLTVTPSPLPLFAETSA